MIFIGMENLLGKHKVKCLPTENEIKFHFAINIYNEKKENKFRFKLNLTQVNFVVAI